MRVFADDMASLLRMPSVPAKRPAPLERALAARLLVLSTIAAFGHLRTVEVAAACWPTMRSGLQMARRCLKKCVIDKQLRCVPNSVGTMSYVVTSIGASVLRAHGRPGKQGLDLRSVRGGTFLHHSVNSRFTIEQRNLGHLAFTEYAIASGCAPISDSRLLQMFKKRSDGIVIRNQTELWLSEVESAWKSRDELTRILLQLEKVGDEVTAGVRLAGVIFAFNDAVAHPKRIEAAALELWKGRPAQKQRELAGRCLIGSLRYRLPLTFESYSEVPLTI